MNDYLRSAQKNLLEEFKMQNTSSITNKEPDDQTEETINHKLYERIGLGLGKEVSFFPYDSNQ